MNVHAGKIVLLDFLHYHVISSEAVCLILTAGYLGHLQCDGCNGPIHVCYDSNWTYDPQAHWGGQDPLYLTCAWSHGSAYKPASCQRSDRFLMGKDDWARKLAFPASHSVPVSMTADCF